MEAILTEQINKSYIWRSIDINKVRGRIDEISQKLDKVVPNSYSNSATQKEQKSAKIPVVVVIVSPDF